MSDIKRKLDERWREKRKSSFNWIKVIVMLLILVAILVVMNNISQNDSIQWGEQTPRHQTVPADSTGALP